MNETRLAHRIRGRIASGIPANLGVRLTSGPICSFAFDDCPRSAFLEGGRILEDVGAAGTYFVTSSLALEDSSAGMVTRDDLVEMVSRGHEIGCHTYSHQSVMGRSATDLAKDLDLNAVKLREAANLEGLFTFAYPYGQVSWTAKRVCGGRFAACRGVREGMNYRLMDLSQLRASRIFHPTFAFRHFSELVRTCKRRGAWLIFYTHDVTERPSEWGCTPQEFTSVVREVVDAGIQILTIKAAVGRMMFRSHS